MHDRSRPDHGDERTAAAPSGSTAAVVDAAATGPLLVFGSPPPGGRDLDVLVPDLDAGRVEAALREAGFERHGFEWVRFRGCRAEAVDAVPSSSWSLPEPEHHRLFADAEPLEGYRRLHRPAAADELLVFARRALGVHAPLAEKHRRRIAAALDRDPEAWARAAHRAAAWRSRHGLAALRWAHERTRPPRTLRARAAGEAARRDGVSARAALRTVAAGLAGRPIGARGAVVALDGVEGSAVDTQAAALSDALTALGHHVVVRSERTPDSARSVAEAVVELCTVRAHVRRGRIVVRPRARLDRPEGGHGVADEAPPARRLLRRLAPGPAIVFRVEAGPGATHVDEPVPPPEAVAGAPAPGSVYVDGSRSAEAVAADIARRTWRLLR